MSLDRKGAFVSLWVIALLFVIALLVGVLSGGNWLVSALMVVIAAAVGGIFIFALRKAEAGDSRRFPEPKPEEPIDPELLAAINIMVVERMKEIDTIAATPKEDLGAFGELDSRIRQARDYSLSEAIASTPQIVQSDRELVGVMLNRAWRISKASSLIACQTSGDFVSGEIYATSGGEGGISFAAGEGHAAPELTGAVASDLREKRFARMDIPAGLGELGTGAAECWAFAIAVGAEVWGWVLLLHQTEKEPTESQVKFLAALGLETAAALSAKRTWEGGREEIMKIFHSLGEKIDRRRGLKYGRGARVAALLELSARQMEVSPAEMTAALAAAHLMDLGELGVPELILNKAEQLSPQEKKYFERHPALSVKILRYLALLPAIEEIVVSHHERWDGQGYPGRLKREEIPRMARLLAICDAYESMVSERKWREAMPPGRAAKVLMEEKGRQFDPDLVKFVIEASEEWSTRFGI